MDFISETPVNRNYCRIYETAWLGYTTCFSRQNGNQVSTDAYLYSVQYPDVV